jgi:hypothetical protein
MDYRASDLIKGIPGVLNLLGAWKRIWAEILLNQSLPNDWVNIHQLAHEYKDDLMTRLIKRPSDSGGSNRSDEHKNLEEFLNRPDDLIEGG